MDCGWSSACFNASGVLMSGLGVTAPLLEQSKPISGQEKLLGQVRVAYENYVIPLQESITVADYGVYAVPIPIHVCNDLHFLQITIVAGASATTAGFPCK